MTIPPSRNTAAALLQRLKRPKGSCKPPLDVRRYRTLTPAPLAPLSSATSSPDLSRFSHPAIVANRFLLLVSSSLASDSSPLSSASSSPSSSSDACGGLAIYDLEELGLASPSSPPLSKPLCEHPFPGLMDDIVSVQIADATASNNPASSPEAAASSSSSSSYSSSSIPPHGTVTILLLTSLGSLHVFDFVYPLPPSSAVDLVRYMILAHPPVQCLPPRSSPSLPLQATCLAVLENDDVITAAREVGLSEDYDPTMRLVHIVVGYVEPQAADVFAVAATVNTSPTLTFMSLLLSQTLTFALDGLLPAPPPSPAAAVLSPPPPSRPQGAKADLNSSPLAVISSPNLPFSSSLTRSRTSSLDTALQSSSPVTSPQQLPPSPKTKPVQHQRNSLTSLSTSPSSRFSIDAGSTTLLPPSPSSFANHPASINYNMPPESPLPPSLCSSDAQAITVVRPSPPSSPTLSRLLSVAYDVCPANSCVSSVSSLSISGQLLLQVLLCEPSRHHSDTGASSAVHPPASHSLELLDATLLFEAAHTHSLPSPVPLSLEQVCRSRILPDAGCEIHTSGVMPSKGRHPPPSSDFDLAPPSRSSIGAESFFSQNDASFFDVASGRDRNGSRTEPGADHARRDPSLPSSPPRRRSGSSARETGASSSSSPSRRPGGGGGGNSSGRGGGAATAFGLKQPPAAFDVTPRIGLGGMLSAGNHFGGGVQAFKAREDGGGSERAFFAVLNGCIAAGCVVEQGGGEKMNDGVDDDAGRFFKNVISWGVKSPEDQIRLLSNYPPSGCGPIMGFGILSPLTVLSRPPRLTAALCTSSGTTYLLPLSRPPPSPAGGASSHHRLSDRVDVLHPQSLSSLSSSLARVQGGDAALPSSIGSTSTAVSHGQGPVAADADDGGGGMPGVVKGFCCGVVLTRARSSSADPRVEGGRCGGEVGGRQVSVLVYCKGGFGGGVEIYEVPKGPDDDSEADAASEESLASPLDPNAVEFSPPSCPPHLHRSRFSLVSKCLSNGSFDLFVSLVLAGGDSNLHVHKHHFVCLDAAAKAMGECIKYKEKKDEGMDAGAGFVIANMPETTNLFFDFISGK